MKKRMYKRGGCILTIKDLSLELLKGKYVYYNYKPYHPLWVGEMHLAFLISAIACGQFSYATLTEYGHEVLMKRAEQALTSGGGSNGQSTL